MRFTTSAVPAHPSRLASRLPALAAAATGLALAALLLPLPGLGSFGSVPTVGASTPHVAPSYGGGYFMGADATGGYWTTSPSGVVDPHDGATNEGSLLGVHLNKPIMGMASTPDGGGYWLVASDGGIFSFGDAAYYGSTGGISLNKPIVGMAPTPDGRGYWLVASDGGIFSFGDAQFYGSTGAITLNKPIVAMAPTPDGSGYWLVASDGGIFTFGDAPFEGSLGSAGASVEGMVVDSATEGYMLVETGGNAEAYGMGQAPANLASGSSDLSSVLGVYAGPGDPQAVSDFTSTVGGQPQYAMDYLDGTSWSTLSNPSWFLQRWGCQAGSSTCSGYHMTWSVPMLLDSGTSLAAEAAGDYDGDFTTLAQNLVASGQGSSVIRLGWEFNGNWFPWAAGGQASTFVGAFQQVVDSMRAVGGANFRFEWNPNIGDLGVGNLASYYPGDAYVDYVGLDLYDGDWGTYSGIQSEFQKWETEAYGLNWLAAFSAAHAKPMTFGEWGLGWGTCSASGQAISAANGEEACGGDDGAFVADMAGWFATHNVYEATFFDSGSSSVDAGANPNTAAALRANF